MTDEVMRCPEHHVRPDCRVCAAATEASLARMVAQLRAFDYAVIRQVAADGLAKAPRRWSWWRFTLTMSR